MKCKETAAKKKKIADILKKGGMENLTYHTEGNKRRGKQLSNLFDINGNQNKDHKES